MRAEYNIPSVDACSTNGFVDVGKVESVGLSSLMILLDSTVTANNTKYLAYPHMYNNNMLVPSIGGGDSPKLQDM